MDSVTVSLNRVFKGLLQHTIVQIRQCRLKAQAYEINECKEGSNFRCGHARSHTVYWSHAQDDKNDMR